jgi:hypothetical protein
MVVGTDDRGVLTEGVEPGVETGVDTGVELGVDTGVELGVETGVEATEDELSSLPRPRLASAGAANTPPMMTAVMPAARMARRAFVVQIVAEEVFFMVFPPVEQNQRVFADKSTLAGQESARRYDLSLMSHELQILELAHNSATSTDSVPFQEFCARSIGV